jgi:hypothetical protein
MESMGAAEAGVGLVTTGLQLVVCLARTDDDFAHVYSLLILGYI